MFREGDKLLGPDKGQVKGDAEVFGQLGHNVVQILQLLPGASGVSSETAAKPQNVEVSRGGGHPSSDPIVVKTILHQNSQDSNNDKIEAAVCIHLPKYNSVKVRRVQGENQMTLTLFFREKDLTFFGGTLELEEATKNHGYAGFDTQGTVISTLGSLHRQAGNGVAAREVMGQNINILNVLGSLLNPTCKIDPEGENINSLLVTG